MPSQDKNTQASPFEIITPGKARKTGKKGIIIGVSIVVFLILSVVAGVLLVGQQQNVQEKAVADICPGVEACPVSGQPNLLKNCHPADGDGSAIDSLCDTVGRVETCGAAGTEYCCPSVGGSWTTDMSACDVEPTPTATTTSTATPTPTATPTGNASATPTPTATPTGLGSSCNGTCGSNSNCQSGYYCYSGFCRNPLCASDSTCGCASKTATPTATATSAGVGAAQTTPLPIPVTGTDWTTYAGIGIGAFAIIVSILLAL